MSEVLQQALTKAVDGDARVHGGILLVDAPRFRWQGASGMADRHSGLAIHADDQFLTASVTKMVTATAVMMLAEEGRVDLDDGIGCSVPDRLISGLHVLERRSHGPRITVRQLLSHRSGLADFFGDGEPDPSGLSPFLALMVREPDRLWNPEDVLAWTKDALAARFPPGQGWHYSDTGYLLAGLLIEAVTDTPLHQVLRRRILDPLEMAETYMLFRESPRPGSSGRPPAHACMGEQDYGALRSSSADWAGGGLVSSAGDLARFIRAFAGDCLLRRSRSREMMLTWTPTGEPGVSYGLGMRRFVLGELGMPGFGELWGHTGFVKSFMLYWPQRDIVFCGTLNQSQAKGVFSGLRPVSALIPAIMRVLGARDHEAPR